MTRECVSARSRSCKTFVRRFVSGAEHLAQPGSTLFGQLGNEMAGRTGNSDWLVINEECPLHSYCPLRAGEKGWAGSRQPIILLLRISDCRFQISNY